MRRCCFLFFALILSSCGYTLKSSSSKALETLGIRTVYVQPLINNTYKAGIEATAYNALIKALTSQGGVRLVDSKNNADAVLKGTVEKAEYNSFAATQTDLLQPVGQGRGDVRIATNYTASLTCVFELNRTRQANPSIEKKVWQATFVRNKNFSANTQLGVLGTTSALINDSEFDRALQNLADAMMVDVHQGMTALF